MGRAKWEREGGGEEEEEENSGDLSQWRGRPLEETRDESGGVSSCRKCSCDVTSVHLRQCARPSSEATPHV